MSKLTVSLLIVAIAQTLNPSPRAIATQSRSLTLAEVAQIVAAARDAIAGKTFKLSYAPDRPGPTILMGTAGRPRFVRAGTDLTEFTGRPARKCDGGAATGELVIDYHNDNGRWTARARTRTPMEFAASIFDILDGTTAAADGATKTIDGRRARALAAPWKPPAGSQPGGPLAPDLVQMLWIDVETLLPLRWEVSAPTVSGYGLSFTYEALDIRAPDRIDAPQCIS